eukprot:CAMPEP_0171925446 /NCGR_PEP_ID=MMETSP0993-20121228/23981_1 /TAXON_ID=483369 /ORGANISM="non described non described, Strain CCMP2098" /LENGTH=114 /DNA_ID=CAMNT_0012564031 /DNA_START=387 /DNA_END=731 /DNA_ORIENTATION=+
MKKAFVRPEPWGATSTSALENAAACSDTERPDASNSRTSKEPSPTSAERPSLSASTSWSWFSTLRVPSRFNTRTTLRLLFRLGWHLTQVGSSSPVQSQSHVSSVAMMFVSGASV